MNSTHTAIETQGVKHSLNPFDELSIEEAVRIREKKSYPSGVEEIVAFTAGPAKSLDVLRTAMAMGADRSLHVETDQDLEPLTVAKILKKVVEKEKINLVFAGKQSIDDDASQTGQMLAGLLGWGQATQACRVGFVGEDKVEVEREVDGGTDTVRGQLPMVVTTDLRLNEPRYASLPGIMKAKKKVVEKSKLEDWGVDGRARLKVRNVEGECFGGVRCEMLMFGRTTTAEGWRQGRGCGWYDSQVEGVGRYMITRGEDRFYDKLIHSDAKIKTD